MKLNRAREFIKIDILRKIIYFDKLLNKVDNYSLRSKNININKYIYFKIIDNMYLTCDLSEDTYIVR